MNESADSDITDDGWTPGRWWTVLYADERTYSSGPSAGQPQIWCQTSDEDEAREAVRTCPGGGKLYREYTRQETRLVEA
ncbi:hypothetical protein AB4Z39_23845 [Mycobacterium adipatum]|jgi:hypothetical protein|uniref:hypothetical protein n=1 Tax=Mycobacterium adipatum TaxID=1682113 RepID=UPI0034E0C82A